MAHHGKENFDFISKEMKQITEAYRKENENNMWPDGMLREDDDGVIHMALGVEKNRVIIVFPEPIKWIGMTPEQAINIASDLIKNAKKAGLSKPVEIKL